MADNPLATNMLAGQAAKSQISQLVSDFKGPSATSQNALVGLALLKESAGTEDHRTAVQRVIDAQTRWMFEAMNLIDTDPFYYKIFGYNMDGINRLASMLQQLAVEQELQLTLGERVKGVVEKDDHFKKSQKAAGSAFSSSADSSTSA